MKKQKFISSINITYAMSIISNTNKIYKCQNVLVIMKKRVVITLDSDIVESIEKMRSHERFKPPFSQVVNSLLKEQIKKESKKNGKQLS